MDSFFNALTVKNGITLVGFDKRLFIAYDGRTDKQFVKNDYLLVTIHDLKTRGIIFVFNSLDHFSSQEESCSAIVRGCLKSQTNQLLERP